MSLSSLTRVLVLLSIDADNRIRKRKIPITSGSVSEIKGRGVGASPMASGAAGTPRATAAVGNTNGPSLGAMNQELKVSPCKLNPLEPNPRPSGRRYPNS